MSYSFRISYTTIESSYKVTPALLIRQIGDVSSEVETGLIQLSMMQALVEEPSVSKLELVPMMAFEKHNQVILTVGVPGMAGSRHIRALTEVLRSPVATRS